MAVQDIRSNLQQKLAFLATITSDTTTNPADAGIIDTADFELGLMFALVATAYTDGDYTLLLEESDADDMTGAVTISGDKLIGALPAVSAATALGGIAGTVGVISNLRYVRASIVSDNTTSGATVAVLATQKAEDMPVI